MITALLGMKLSQTQQFTENGKRIPVTKIQAGPCWVVRMQETGVHKSVTLGFGTTKNINKPQEGQLKKAGLDKKPRFFRDIRVSNLNNLGNVSIGSQINVGDVFAAGDNIQVTGVSKGKGFAGVVKRHKFAGGPRTHGQSDRERAPGSIGQTTTPGRVYKGKRMAGRMGSDRVTVRGLTVVAVDPEKNILTVSGLVPGAISGLLMIQKEG